MSKGKGQRHEMTVLVVAVGVLVVAVGLFFLHSRPAPPPPPSAPVGAQETPPAVPVPDGEKSPVGRDPFAAKPAAPPQPAAPRPGPGPGQKPAARQQPQNVAMTLVGVMTGASPVAVIHKGNRRYYVKAGQTVSGYRVARVSTDRVVLSKGTEQVTLLLHPPVLEED